MPHSHHRFGSKHTRKFSSSNIIQFMVSMNVVSKNVGTYNRDDCQFIFLHSTFRTKISGICRQTLKGRGVDNVALSHTYTNITSECKALWGSLRKCLFCTCRTHACFCMGSTLHEKWLTDCRLTKHRGPFSMS